MGKFDKYKRIKKKREKNILKLPETKLDITLKKSILQTFYEKNPNAPVIEIFLRFVLRGNPLKLNYQLLYYRNF